MSFEWDRHAILAEIKRRGETLASLERHYGLRPYTLGVALRRPFPKAEKYLARFLNQPVATLFAYRLDGSLKTRPLQHQNPSRPTAKGASQKRSGSADMGEAA